MAKKKQRDPGGDTKGQRRRELATLEGRLDTLMATDQRQRAKLARTQERIEAVKARLRELGGPGAPAGDTPSADRPAASAAPAHAVVAYCLRERRRVELTDFVPVTLRNGRSAVAGTCPGCGVRIVSLAARQA